MSHRCLALLVLVAVSAAGFLPCASAEEVKVRTVEVSGMGLTRDAAVKDAMRKAVEEGAGAMMYSESQTRDFVLVRDTVLARAQGFVESHDVLAAEEMVDGSWEVRIRAVVSVAGIRDLWGTVKSTLKQVGRPRIVVFVNEKIGNRKNEDSTVQARIENLLLDSGFILMDKKQIESIIDLDRQEALLQDDPDKIVALLRDSRAQIVITGTAHCEPQGARNVSGIQLHSFEAEANIRCFRVDTGQLISKIPGQPTRGSGRVARSAAKMALDLQAQQIAPEVQQDVLRFWLDAVGGHNELNLEVSGLDFGKYIQLKKALESIDGVEAADGKFNQALTRMRVQTSIGAEDLAMKLYEQGVEFLEITEVSQNVIRCEVAE